MEKSVESGRFVFWRTIIRPPFTFEWRDREVCGLRELSQQAQVHLTNIIQYYTKALQKL